MTAQEVWAVEPVLRRVIAARVSDDAAVDDLVQDALEHLLKARGRLAQELMVPYGVVTARNLAASHGRKLRRSDALKPRLVDLVQPESPDEVVLRSEERAAITAALARLPEEERQSLVDHELGGTPVAVLTKDGRSVGATRVRLARSRAKLRVEYLLALRDIQLPSADCRSTLLALAGGDQARQRSAATGRHLFRCETCASLSEPLVERRRGLAVLVPVVMLRRLLHITRSHPVISAAAAAATAGSVAVAVVLAAGGAPPPAVASTPTPAATVSAPPAPTPTTPPSPLTVDGRALPGGGVSFAYLVGQQAVARRALVVAVVAHNGFWISSGGANRVWVELVGPLRPLRVMVGEHVSFVAVVVSQPPGYAAAAGVDETEGAATLTAEGAHIAVPTTAIVVGA